nr:MAG TPA: hypothetical protein [Caudoviricetes sp.]
MAREREVYSRIIENFSEKKCLKICLINKS